MPDSQGVTFYKRIVGEDGRSFITRIDRIEEAGSGDVDTAIAEFERKYDVDDWRQLADRYRVAS